MTRKATASMKIESLSGSELDDLIEAFTERAAILEYDGGLPRSEAEREAWQMILRDVSGKILAETLCAAVLELRVSNRHHQNAQREARVERVRHAPGVD